VSSKLRSIYRLTDILARIPGLVEDSDPYGILVPSCPSAFCRGARHSRFEILTEKTTAIVDSIILLLRDLFQWRFHFATIHPQLAYEVAVTFTRDWPLIEPCKPLFDKAIHYRDYHRGREVLLYNTALLMLLYLLHFWTVKDGVARALRPHLCAANGLASNVPDPSK
jgi:hypothetical protein